VALELAQRAFSRLVVLSVVEEEGIGAMHDGRRRSPGLLEQAREHFEQAGMACEVTNGRGTSFVIGDVAG